MTPASPAKRVSRNGRAAGTRAGKKHARIRTPRTIYAISDSTGNLARHMLGAFLTQFPPGSFSLRVEPFVRGLPKLLELLACATAENAAVCHALVSVEFKQFVQQSCKKAGLACCDLTGGIVRFLSEAAGAEPLPDIDALHRVDDAYQQRIVALEYTIGHDDGLGLETLHEADLILVGVSRTSKTPTSIYLAQQGYRVANVALARGVPPPAELLRIRERKVVGLVIKPDQLALIRTRREIDWNMQATAYGDLRHVSDEITWARRLFMHQNWPVIDVTDQAIEETAARILAAVKIQQDRPAMTEAKQENPRKPKESVCSPNNGRGWSPPRSLR